MNKLFFLLSLLLMASLPLCFSTKVDFVINLQEISQENYSNFGIIESKSKFEIFYVKFNKDNEKKYSRIVISKGKIEKRNIASYENITFSNLSPVLIMYQFGKKYTSYFRDLKEYQKYSSDNSSLKEKTDNYINVNTDKWQGFRLKTANENELITLWYDTTEVSKDDLKKEFPSEIEKTNEPVNSKSSNTNIEIFPNPVLNNKATLNFEVNSEISISISIYDISGKLIQSIKSNENTFQGKFSEQINLNGFESGLYLVSISTNQNEQFVKKIIIISNR